MAIIAYFFQIILKGKVPLIYGENLIFQFLLISYHDGRGEGNEPE